MALMTAAFALRTTEAVTAEAVTEGPLRLESSEPPPLQEAQARYAQAPMPTATSDHRSQEEQDFPGGDGGA